MGTASRAKEWTRESWSIVGQYTHVVYRDSGDPMVIMRCRSDGRWVVASNYDIATQTLPATTLRRAKVILNTYRLLDEVPPGWRKGEWQ